jgi:uncharacterized caspase-like protein
MEASMLKHFTACLLGVVVLFAALTPAAAEKRVALVIGNAAYQNAPPLRNPSNDATDIAAKLRVLGFDVVEGIDLGKRDMEKRIRAFAEQLNGADVGLFYYAGHGLQVNQKNYLAPIDAELKSETDLDFEAVELDLVLKQMLRSAGTSLVFLDACRDNPLVQKLAQSGRSLNIGRGLARVEPVSSMMIVYSAEFGKVALDGTGRNSPFTEALLRHIGEEGESISDMMIEVRNDVRKETGNQQQPIESTQLTGQFFFKPASQQAAAKSSSTDTEIAALRQEIARLQADQGALLKSQQEQLALLQKKLAEETKPSEATAPQPNVPASGTPSRVIAVEPAGGGTNSAPATTSASAPQQAAMRQLRRKPPSSPRPKARVPSRRRLKLQRRPKRRCRKAPRAKSWRRTSLSNSSGSAVTSAASTAIGAHARNLPLSASTGTPRLSFRSMSRNRQASTP